MAGTRLEPESLQLGDLALDLLRGGDGPPLLLLHGENGLLPDAPFLAPLLRRHDVVAPIHPGFGAARLPSWIDAVDDYVHLYIALLERLDLRDVTLVGCSLGGWMAAELATKNASRLARLVLVAPFGIKIGSRDRLDIPDIFAMSQDRLDTLQFYDPRSWHFDPSGKSDAELLEIARRRETLALIGWEPYLHNPKLARRLFAIDRPALILRGAADRLVSDDYARGFAERIPGALYETIDEAGHWPELEQPARFSARLLRFAG